MLSALSVVSIAVILLFLDLPLALVDAAVVPVPALALALVPARVGPGLPAYPGGGRAGDRPLRRVARRDPGGAGVPPRAAQPGDLRGRQRRVPRRPTCAPSGSSRPFSPGIKLIGNVTIAVVLTFGGVPGAARPDSRSACSPRSCSTCASSSSRCRSCRQFYNSLQSATAALEKLSGVLTEQPVGRPSRLQPRPLPAGRGPGRRSTSTAVDLRLPAPTGWCCTARPDASRPARRSRWSARPAPARPRWPS